MKNIFLPALLWALALSPLFAQKQLPHSAAVFTSNWKDSVKDLLDKAGFGTAPAEKQRGVQSRNELQLDSTITFYGYGLNGTQDSTPLFRSVYTYIASQNAEVMVEDLYENSQWAPQTRTTSISDDQGRLVELLAELYDPAAQVWTPDSRIELFPLGNAPDALDSFFVYAWDPAAIDWARIMSTWNSFDNAGRLLESLSQFDIFGQPLLFKDTYTYDANGDNTLIESFLVDGGFELPTGSRELTYENHFVTSVTSLTDDGFGTQFPTDRITYEYTSFWKEETVNTYVWDPEQNNWLLTQSDAFEYDGEERVIQKLSTLFNGDNDKVIDRYNYAYVEDNYLDVEASYTFDFTLDEFVLMDRKYYYYGGTISSTPFEPVIAKKLAVSPNPTTGFAQLNLREEASVHVFDLQGQLVRWFDLQPGQTTLNVQDLPAGIYQVRALTNDGYYVGRLVKQ